MRAPEPIPGTRVVASAEVLDRLPTAEGKVHLRFAADELFVLDNHMLITPEPMLIESETGFVGWQLSQDELSEVLRRVEWAAPENRPILLQGLIAGVPAKLWLAEDQSLLLVAAPYAHELLERLP